MRNGVGLKAKILMGAGEGGENVNQKSKDMITGAVQMVVLPLNPQVWCNSSSLR